MKSTQFAGIIIIWLSLLSIVSAQNYNFNIHHINTTEGLPNRNVFEITEDQKGYIWVSTLGNISRYNGTEFKSYNASFLNISDQKPINIAIDNDQNLWYSEKHVLDNEFNGAILNLQTDSIISFKTFSNGLFSKNDVMSVKASSFKKGVIHITTKQGIVY